MFIFNFFMKNKFVRLKLQKDPFVQVKLVDNLQKLIFKTRGVVCNKLVESYFKSARKVGRARVVIISCKAILTRETLESGALVSRLPIVAHLS